MFGRSLRQTVSMFSAVLVAGTVWLALSTSAKMFSRSSQSLRKTIESSRRSMTHQVEGFRSVVKETDQQRHQILGRREELPESADSQRHAVQSQHRENRQDDRPPTQDGTVPSE